MKTPRLLPGLAAAVLAGCGPVLDGPRGPEAADTVYLLIRSDDGRHWWT